MRVHRSFHEWAREKGMFIIYDQLNRYSLLFLSLTFFMTYTRSDAGWVGCTLLRTKLWINVVYSAEAGTFDIF